MVELYEALGLLYGHGGDRKSEAYQNQSDSESLRSIEDIAEKKFHIRREVLQRDIQLADALEERPELAKETSKKKAPERTEAE